MERAGSGGKLFGPSPRKLKLGYTTTPQTPTDGGWCCILASLSGNCLQETLNLIGPLGPVCCFSQRIPSFMYTSVTGSRSRGRALPYPSVPMINKSMNHAHIIYRVRGVHLYAYIYTSNRAAQSQKLRRRFPWNRFRFRV